MAGGFFGVDIFFVLSGFLITTLLLDEYARTGDVDLGRFYLRRVLRLFPALVVLCLVLVALRLATGDHRLTGGVAPALLYVANWVRAVPGSDLGPLEPTWSLAIEEQFYLVWPLLLVLLRRSPRWALVVALVGATSSAVWRALLWTAESDYWRVSNGFDTRVEAILIGCALALAASLGVFRRLSGRVAGVASLIGLGVLAGWAVRGSAMGRPTFEGGVTLVSLAAAALIIGLAIRPVPLIVRLFSSAPLVAAGKLSYGLYLWNVPVLRLMEASSARMPTPLAVGVVLLLNWLLAWTSFKVVERPFLRLKDRLARPRGDAPAASPRRRTVAAEKGSTDDVHPAAPCFRSGVVPVGAVEENSDVIEERVRSPL